MQAQENGKKNAGPCLLIHPIITQGKVKASLIKDYSYFTGHLPFTRPAELWKAAITSETITDPAGPGYSRWPPFARGDGEEREQSPEHVVVVKLVFFPFPGLRLHLIFFIIEVLTPGKNSFRPNERIKPNQPFRVTDWEASKSPSSRVRLCDVLKTNKETGPRFVTEIKASFGDILSHRNCT